MAQCLLIDFNSQLDSGVDSKVYADVPDEIAACNVDSVLIQRVVRWQLFKRRSGTAHTKKIGDVSATTRKPWRQKGTGRARHGNLVAPQFRGGGVAFGPVPRDHSHNINKKIRRKVIRMALAMKFCAGALLVSRGNIVEGISTKRLVHNLESRVGMVGPTLYCASSFGNDVLLSGRNVGLLCMLPVCGLNVYDIIRCDRIVIDESAVEDILRRTQ